MKKLRIFLVLLIPLLLSSCLGYTGDNPSALDKKAIVSSKTYQVADLDRVNILLIGLDAREGETETRADTIIVVSIDKETDQVILLSIPRDSRIMVPGHGKMRINQANTIGGAKLVAQTVENLLNLEIHYYVKTNFQGFEEIIDTLGGVEIDVEKNMYYLASDIEVRLKKGTQRLDGDKALQYVRFRHDALGDITRTQRQQKLLKAFAVEALQWSNLPKLPKLIPQIKDNVETNLSTKDILYLAAFAKQLDQEEIITQTLPGSFPPSGAGYWKVDVEKAKVVIDELLQGKTMETIEEI